MDIFRLSTDVLKFLSATLMRCQYAAKILIVDDDIISLDLMAYLFEKNGYQVIRCSDGKSGIDTFFEENPDILLFDIMMPGMNGIEAINHIRRGREDEEEDYQGKNVPIIAFTAGTVSEFKSKCEEAGCDRFLTKPISLQELLEITEGLLIEKGVIQSSQSKTKKV